MEMSKKTLRNVFLGVAGCIVLYWLLHEPERLSNLAASVSKVISPFVVGAILAFILNVPMRGIEKMLGGIQKPGARRAVAILLTMLAVLLVLAGVIYLLVPQVVKTVESLVDQLPGFFARMKDITLRYLTDHPELMEWLKTNTSFEAINWSGLIQEVITWISGSLTNIVDVTISTVITLGTGIFNAVLSLVFGLYCLSRKEILARQGRRLLYAFFPEKFGDETVRILRMANSTFSNFISGQCLEALILGLMFAVAMTIFRMPYMPLVSVVIAITALVPIVGAFVGCAVGAFFILVDNPLQAVWFVIMFLILQQIEGNMIYPRVVGTSIGLPGMWVLVAVAVGGDLMGVGGMLLMIPIVSVLYALTREITDKRLTQKEIQPEKLRDHPPELKSNFREQRRKNKEKRHLKCQKKMQENVPEEHKEET